MSLYSFFFFMSKLKASSMIIETLMYSLLIQQTRFLVCPWLSSICNSKCQWIFIKCLGGSINPSIKGDSNCDAAAIMLYEWMFKVARKGFWWIISTDWSQFQKFSERAWSWGTVWRSEDCCSIKQQWKKLGHRGHPYKGHSRPAGASFTMAVVETVL